MVRDARQIMTAKGITLDDIAELLQLAPDVAEEKLYGKNPVTIEEAFRLKEFFFREYDLDYLFAEDPPDAPRKPRPDISQ